MQLMLLLFIFFTLQMEKFYTLVEHTSSSTCQTQSLLISRVQPPMAPTYRQETGALASAPAAVTSSSVSTHTADNPNFITKLMVYEYRQIGLKIQPFIHY